MKVRPSAPVVVTVDDLIAYVAECFRSFKRTELTPEVWAHQLRDIEMRWLLEAADRLCGDGRKFAPEVGEIRTLARALRLEAQRKEEMQRAAVAARIPPAPMTLEQRLRFRAGLERALPGIRLEPLVPAAEGETNNPRTSAGESESH